MQPMRDWNGLWLRIGVIALLAVFVTGCGRTMPQERSYGAKSLDQQQHASVVNDRNNDVIDRGAPAIEDRDQLMGRNQNPNLQIGQSAVLTNNVDMRNMEMMAKSVPGVENVRVTLNGGNAYVTLDLIPNVTANQARTIESQVISALRQKVPRYDFHITSHDGYHR